MVVGLPLVILGISGLTVSGCCIVNRFGYDWHYQLVVQSKRYLINIGKYKNNFNDCLGWSTQSPRERGASKANRLPKIWYKRLAFGASSRLFGSLIINGMLVICAKLIGLQPIQWHHNRGIIVSRVKSQVQQWWQRLQWTGTSRNLGKFFNEGLPGVMRYRWSRHHDTGPAYNGNQE